MRDVASDVLGSDSTASTEPGGAVSVGVGDSGPAPWEEGESLRSLRVLSTVESIESILDSMWRDPRFDQVPSDYDSVYYGLIYSRMFIISFLASAIASYIDVDEQSKTDVYSMASQLEGMARSLAFRSRTSSVWIPSGEEEYSDFLRGSHKFLSRCQDFLSSIPVPLITKFNNRERFEDSLERATSYLHSSKHTIRSALSGERVPLSKIAALFRRTAKLFRLIRDGLFSYRDFWL